MLISLNDAKMLPKPMPPVALYAGDAHAVGDFAYRRTHARGPGSFAARSGKRRF